jgi:hypothetical protein
VQKEAHCHKKMATAITIRLATLLGAKMTPYSQEISLTQ